MMEMVLCGRTIGDRQIGWMCVLQYKILLFFSFTLIGCWNMVCIMLYSDPNVLFGPNVLSLGPEGV